MEPWATFGHRVSRLSQQQGEGKGKMFIVGLIVGLFVGAMIGVMITAMLRMSE